MWPHPTPHKVLRITPDPGRSAPRSTSAKKIYGTGVINHLHMHQGSPLIPILLSTPSCLFMCSNNLNTFWSTHATTSLSIPTLLRTSLFRNLSIRVTPTILLKHFFSKTFTLLISALFILHVSDPYNAVGTITPSYRHILAFVPIFYCVAHFLALCRPHIPHIHSVYHIEFISSIRCHLRPQALKTIYFL